MESMIDYTIAAAFYVTSMLLGFMILFAAFSKPGKPKIPDKSMSVRQAERILRKK